MESHKLTSTVLQGRGTALVVPRLSGHNEQNFSFFSLGVAGPEALLYFEVLSSLALVIGLVVVNLIRPGAGINANPATLDTKAIEIYTKGASEHSTLDFFLNIIPTTVVGAFADGEILQVLAQKSGAEDAEAEADEPEAVADAEAVFALQVGQNGATEPKAR
jgi:Sodium:dicarboxylate symporter family